MSPQKFLIFHRAKIAKTVLLSLLIPALFFCLPQTTANAVEGNVLVQWKNEFSKLMARNPEVEVSFVEAGMYTGYVQGFVDATTLFAMHAKVGNVRVYGDVKAELLRISKAPLMNAPGKVPMSQLLAIIGKYLDDNPDQWTRPGGFLVKDALFPLEPAK